MAKCSYCGEGVAMPYRCSLCNERNCGRHRLPEQHECLNISTFQTSSYSQKRLQKTREMQQISAGNDPDTGMKMVQMQNSLPGNFWEPPKQFQGILLAGLLLGFVSGLEEFTNLGFNLSGFTYLSMNIVLVIIGFSIIYLFRMQKANELGFSTKFVFWPIGIAIALVLSLFSWVFHLFGLFMNQAATLEEEAKLAKHSAYTFSGFFIAMQAFHFFFSNLFGDLLPIEIVESLDTASVDIFWFGILIMIPFGIFDGAKLYAYDRRSYFKHIGFMVLLAIIALF